MNDFAVWLSTTPPSVFIQNHQVWMIPVIQSLHIVGIGIAVGSTLMMTLRVLGWAGMDQTVRAIQRRFGPWLTGALCHLQPEREGDELAHRLGDDQQTTTGQ